MQPISGWRLPSGKRSFHDKTNFQFTGVCVSKNQTNKSQTNWSTTYKKSTSEEIKIGREKKNSWQLPEYIYILITLHLPGVTQLINFKRSFLFGIWFVSDMVYIQNISLHIHNVMFPELLPFILLSFHLHLLRFEVVFCWYICCVCENARSFPNLMAFEIRIRSAGSFPLLAACPVTLPVKCRICFYLIAYNSLWASWFIIIWEKKVNFQLFLLSLNCLMNCLDPFLPSLFEFLFHDPKIEVIKKIYEKKRTNQVYFNFRINTKFKLVGVGWWPAMISHLTVTQHLLDGNDLVNQNGDWRLVRFGEAT